MKKTIETSGGPGLLSTDVSARPSRGRRGQDRLGKRIKPGKVYGECMPSYTSSPLVSTVNMDLQEEVHIDGRRRKIGRDIHIMVMS
jgi:hypothetical protein